MRTHKMAHDTVMFTKTGGQIPLARTLYTRLVTYDFLPSRNLNIRATYIWHNGTMLFFIGLRPSLSPNKKSYYCFYLER